MRTLAICVVLFGIVSTDYVWAQTFTTASAYHRDGTLWFMAPSQEGWEELAPAHVRDLPIPTSDPGIVGPLASEMDMWGNVESRATVDLPADLASRYLYFVGSGGVRQLQVDSVQVVTRLSLNPNGTRLQGRQAWGEVFGTAEGLPGGGGFVLIADRSDSFAVASAEFSADDVFQNTGIDALGGGGSYLARGTAFWDIVVQYRVSTRETGREWWFVQWAADGENRNGGCRFRYDLLELEDGRAVRRVAWNSYGCDV